MVSTSAPETTYRTSWYQTETSLTPFHWGFYFRLKLRQVLVCCWSINRTQETCQVVVCCCSYQQDTGNMSSCGVLLDYQQDTGDMSSSTYFMHSTDREILTRVLQTILRPLHFFLTMYKIYDAPFRANLKVSCHSDVLKWFSETLGQFCKVYNVLNTYPTVQQALRLKPGLMKQANCVHDISLSSLFNKRTSKCALHNLKCDIKEQMTLAYSEDLAICCTWSKPT